MRTDREKFIELFQEAFRRLNSPLFIDYTPEQRYWLYVVGIWWTKAVAEIDDLSVEQQDQLAETFPIFYMTFFEPALEAKEELITWAGFKAMGSK